MANIEISKTQKLLWDSYQASGRGGDDLFDSIDTNGSKGISASELRTFLQAITGGDGGVNKHAFDAILGLAGDHELKLKEFLSHLVRFTQGEIQSLDSIKKSYEAQPSVGRRGSMMKSSVAGILNASVVNKLQEFADGGIDDFDTEEEYAWNEVTMAQNLRKMQYAVRGEVVMKADLLKAEGREITYTNIGNPHAVGQKPITYYRQVLALCDLPAECGVEHPDVSKMFPSDVIQRAKEYRSAIPSGTGSYTNSQGVQLFREHIASFIQERDGHAAYPGDIFITNGASAGIQNCLTALIASDKDAIMIPTPQYPIYSALITLLGGRQVGYELNEDAGWAISEEILEKSFADAKAKGLKVKALAIINPGNPTGQVLDKNALEIFCKFCVKRGIVILSDEVYQRNVYVDNKKFISTKKVACETSGCEKLELVSFHSTSKGLIGECGRRGGYMEMHNICPDVHAQLYKMACAGLCSGVAGQVMTSLMVKPPLPSDESYELFCKEESTIFQSLVRRSAALVKGLNAIPGIECQPAEGAMYAFPSIVIPKKAIEEAKRDGKTPDTLYCLSLLEETGICVIPASGFGQKKGRAGFRTTFLPPEQKLFEAIEGFAKHHRVFCDRYAQGREEIVLKG